MLKGLRSRNETFKIVESYFDRISLAKLGYTSSTSEMTDYERDLFVVIEAAINEFNKSAIKQGRNGRY